MDKARNIKISNRRRIHPREQTTRMSCVLNRWMLKLFRKERAVGLACRILTAAVSDIPISWSCGRGWLTSVRVARGVSTSPSAKCHMSQTSEIGSTLYLQGGRYRGSSEPRQTIKPPAPPSEIAAAFIINNRLETSLSISGLLGKSYL